MIERTRHLVAKEFVQTFREKRRVFLILVAPVIQLFLFGYIATMDVNNVATAFVDLDRSQESRELARRLEGSGYFTIVSRPDSPGDIRELLDRGKVLCAIQVNRGFSKDLKKGVPAEVQLIVDGTDSNTGLIAMNYGAAIIARYARDAGSPPPVVRTAAVDFRTRVWYNPDLRSRNYYLPGVIALIIMLTCLMLTSMAVVRERELGTIEQLMVTPIRPLELMLGKTIPFAAIGFGDMVIVTAVAVLWFHIPIKGAFLFLFLCTAVYLLPVLGIGLFISTVSKTQQQAMMASFFFFQPAILLSGFATPIENMPALFQYITYLSPLRYFLVIVRGIFLKGVGLDVLWPQVLALLLLGTGIIMISAMRFKKRLS
ncbi:MAG: Inner membrane transport permease YbhR [Syntrophorhabdaceae bacterium PtaU1.Bin034]|nr:MAG: Inner membrane transport permease YbhR [Syntrophorhabdaceae bacterium PtaU1.Bin034]